MTRLGFIVLRQLCVRLGKQLDKELINHLKELCERNGIALRCLSSNGGALTHRNTVERIPVTWNLKWCLVQVIQVVNGRIPHEELAML